MRKFLSIALFICLMMGLGVGGNLLAQTTELHGKSPAPANPPANKTATTTDELISLLPTSDLIAVVDLGRAFNDLLPRLASLNIGGLDKMVKDIQDFTSKTGIDPLKVQNAVLGLNMGSAQANGAIIIQGIDLDEKKIESVFKAYALEYKTSEYKSKPIYNLVTKVGTPSAGPLSLKTDETAFAVLGQQKFVLGDLTAVKSVIDIHSGASKGGVTAAMSAALKETRDTALLRFALNIPEPLREEASTQGDLFKSVAAIKMIMGTFDVANDFSLSLDTVMRTASQNDATELESGLKGLITLAKGFLSGGDPKTDFFGQLIDQIKVGSKLSDVLFSISLPRSLMDQLGKKADK